MSHNFLLHAIFSHETFSSVICNTLSLKASSVCGPAYHRALISGTHNTCNDVWNSYKVCGNTGSCRIWQTTYQFLLNTLSMVFPVMNKYHGKVLDIKELLENFFSQNDRFPVLDYIISSASTDCFHSILWTWILSDEPRKKQLHDMPGWWTLKYLMILISGPELRDFWPQKYADSWLFKVKTFEHTE